MKTLGIQIWLFLILCVVPFVSAADCPAIVDAALKATNDACRDLGRNQACYGNAALTVEPQAGVTNIHFEKSGDQLEVAKIHTLSLSSFNAQTKQWGVALMRLQANLADTLPGQNVTVLMFGNVEIENAVDPAADIVTFEITAKIPLKIYGQPVPNTAVVKLLNPGETVRVTGWLSDGSWVRVRLADSSNEGWLFILSSGQASVLIDPTDSLDDLAVVQPGTMTLRDYQPMQAFYFHTGIGDAPCEVAPDSGILIETPQGAGAVNFLVNEVNIELGSTVYLQAQPSKFMIVTVLEGSAHLETKDGEVRVIPAGTRLQVPMTDKLGVSSAPGELEPYDNSHLAALPIQHLERRITVAPTLTQEVIDTLSIPKEGEWTQSSTLVRICPDTPVVTQVWDNPNIIITQVTHDQFVVSDLRTEEKYRHIQFTRSRGSALYSADWNYKFEGGTYPHYEYRVVTPSLIVGRITYTQSGCTVETSRLLDLVKAS